MTVCRFGQLRVMIYCLVTMTICYLEYLRVIIYGQMMIAIRKALQFSASFKTVLCCHPERSEGSPEILRCAQDDSILVDYGPDGPNPPYKAFKKR